MKKNPSIFQNDKALRFIKKLRRGGYNLTSGFSLIEIGLVLMIIAALMGTFYGYNAGKDDVVKKRQTLAKMEIIEKALAQYVAENDRLPCPADYRYSSVNGLEFCWSVQAVIPAPQPVNFSSGTSSFVFGGVVPYVALKLPQSITRDAWGNDFTYNVSAGLAGWHGAYGSPSVPSVWETTNMGNITVNDATGAQRTNQAAYVLISHGSNGYGAYYPYSFRSFSSTYDPNEAENAEYATTGGTWNGTFVSSEPYYSTIGTTTNGPTGATGYTSTTSYFDDIVHWKTKWQIIRETGSLLSNSNCTLAYTILTKQDTSYNSVYYNYYCNATSNKPANAMCSFILNSLARKVNDLCLNKVS